MFYANFYTFLQRFEMIENENFRSFPCKFKIEVQFSGRGKDKI